MALKKRKIDKQAEKESTESLEKGNLENEGNVEKKPRLEGEALDELRKMLRERKKKLKMIPNFYLKPFGLDARISTASDIRKQLKMRDLQNLLLYSLLGAQAPVEPSK